jgi:L-iditol 2-dehydrogenase
MKAARVHDRGIITCIETSIPKLQPGEALVKTTCCTICGSDLHEVFQPLRGDTFPCHPGFPGHESVGRIADPGDTGLLQGQRVLAVPDRDAAAGFSEFQAVDRRFLVPVDEAVRAEALCLAQPLGAVIFGLKAYLPRTVPETALVVGQGAIGLFFTWLLKRAGVAQIIVSDPVASRRALAKSFGADVIIDPHEYSVPDAVRQITRSEGARLVIEAAGEDNARRDAVLSVDFDGFVGLFGLPEEDEMQDFPMAELFRRRAALRAIYDSQHEKELRSFRDAIDLISSSAIDVAQMVTHLLPINEVREAFDLARQGKDRSLKTAIIFPD